jgi:exopolysaccharide biosynthesis polyprenyl glycosylphosphotransferase
MFNAKMYAVPRTLVLERAAEAGLSARVVPPVTMVARVPVGPALVERRDRFTRRCLVAADAIAAFVAVAVAVTLLGDEALGPPTFLAPPVAVLISKVIGLYDRDELVLRKSTLDESPQLFQLATLCALLVSVLGSSLGDGLLETGQILCVWGLLFVGASVGRATARSLAAAVTPPERCLVVGDHETAAPIGDRLADRHARRVTLAGSVSLDFDDDPADVMDHVRTAMITFDAERVILAPRAADNGTVLEAIHFIESYGLKVSLLPRIFEVVGGSVVFDDLDGVTVLGVRRFGLSRSSAAVKRAMDVAVAALGLIIAVPFLAVVAAAVRLDSPGPLLFRQVRVGRDGKRFEMLKFRSMGVDADDTKRELRREGEDGDLFKLVDDPRVTRVGRVLRASSLDELPQLFNVLRGDMSLVGPRPLVPEEDALVRGWHRRRLHIVPGMTGPWQVLGSTRVPLQEMVKIDYLYIANWSLWRDVKLLLRTVAHVLRRDGL